MTSKKLTKAIENEHWASLQTLIFNCWEDKRRDFPWRAPGDEWRQVVTEVLLQRTKAEAVAAIYNDFFFKFQSPEQLGNASVKEVEEAIYTLGLAWRAKYLKALGEELATRERVPETTTELKKLSGVGPYVAGAVQVLHRNRHEIFVDANVVRLLGRYFGFEWNGETRRKKWFLALVTQLFAHDFEPRLFGYALLDFTREICGRKPLCEVCPLADKCFYSRENYLPPVEQRKLGN